MKTKLKLLLVVTIVGTLLLMAGCASAGSETQYVTTDLANGYQSIEVQAGIPVEWTIVASEETLTNCNNAISIPEYGIEQELVPGENVITFTPTETGTFTYTCWMDMMSAEIIVVD